MTDLKRTLKPVILIDLKNGVKPLKEIDGSCLQEPCLWI